MLAQTGKTRALGGVAREESDTERFLGVSGRGMKLSRRMSSKPCDVVSGDAWPDEAMLRIQPIQQRLTLCTCADMHSLITMLIRNNRSASRQLYDAMGGGPDVNSEQHVSRNVRWESGNLAMKEQKMRA
jgi:hypothetical protein